MIRSHTNYPYADQEIVVTGAVVSFSTGYSVNAWPPRLWFADEGVLLDETTMKAYSLDGWLHCTSGPTVRAVTQENSRVGYF